VQREAILASLVGIKEAKNNLSELVDRVRAGEAIMVTKRGKPYARLLPLDMSR
jgi:prevent-host-death family protein